MSLSNNYQNIDQFFNNLQINPNLPNNSQANNRSVGQNQPNINLPGNQQPQRNRYQPRNNNGFQAFVNQPNSVNNVGRFANMFANRRESWE